MTSHGKLLFLNLPVTVDVSTAQICESAANIIISYRGYYLPSCNV
jgi:hypothetical protein